MGEELWQSKVNLRFNDEEVKEEKTYVSPSPESRPQHPTKANFMDWDFKIKNVMEKVKKIVEDPTSDEINKSQRYYLLHNIKQLNYFVLFHNFNNFENLGQKMRNHE